MSESDADEGVEPEAVSGVEVIDEITEPEAAEEVAEDVEQGQSDEVEADAEAEVTEESGSSDDAPGRIFEPYSFRVDGQDISLGTLAEHDDGQGGRTESIVIPRAEFDQVRRGLASRSTFDRKVMELTRELEDARDPARNEATVRASTYLNEIDKALDSPEGIHEGNVAALRERLEMLGENAVLKAQREGRTISDTRISDDRASTERDTAIDGDIQQSFIRVLGQSGIQLSDQAKNQLWQDVWDDKGMYYVTQEDGSVLRNDALLLKHIQREGRRTVPSQSQNSRGEAAEETNRKALGKGKDAPKTPPATGGEPVVVANAPLFKDHDEWLRYMAS
jgi:hypothetical protein